MVLAYVLTTIMYFSGPSFSAGKYRQRWPVGRALWSEFAVLSINRSEGPRYSSKEKLGISSVQRTCSSTSEVHEVFVEFSVTNNEVTKHSRSWTLI